jgi:hypothetical protein
MKLKIEGDKTNKKITVLACMILLIAFAISTNRNSLLAFAADSYGNDITHVEVWQFNTTQDILKANFTATAESERIHDTWSTSFIVGVKINSSLVASSAEAISYTRINMTIIRTDTSAYIWNNVPLNNSATATLVSTFYYTTKIGNWTSSLPESGVTYNCTVVYQAYY